jgi:hypothetical protein
MKDPSASERRAGGLEGLSKEKYPKKHKLAEKLALDALSVI